jgi:hypothetical protein
MTPAAFDLEIDYGIVAGMEGIGVRIKVGRNISEIVTTYDGWYERSGRITPSSQQYRLSD